MSNKNNGNDENNNSNSNRNFFQEVDGKYLFIDVRNLNEPLRRHDSALILADALDAHLSATAMMADQDVYRADSEIRRAYMNHEFLNKVQFARLAEIVDMPNLNYGQAGTLAAPPGPLNSAQIPRDYINPILQQATTLRQSDGTFQEGARKVGVVIGYGDRSANRIDRIIAGEIARSPTATDEFFVAMTKSGSQNAAKYGVSPPNESGSWPLDLDRVWWIMPQIAFIDAILIHNHMKLQSRIDDMTRAANSNNNNNNNNASTITNLEQQLNNAHARIRQLEDQLSRAQNNSASAEALRQAHSDGDTLRRQLQEANRNLDEATRVVEDLRAQNEELTAELDAVSDNTPRSSNVGTNNRRTQLVTYDNGSGINNASRDEFRSSDPFLNLKPIPVTFDNWRPVLGAGGSALSVWLSHVTNHVLLNKTNDRWSGLWLQMLNSYISVAHQFANACNDARAWNTSECKNLGDHILVGLHSLGSKASPHDISNLVQACEHVGRPRDAINAHHSKLAAQLDELKADAAAASNTRGGGGGGGRGKRKTKARAAPARAKSNKQGSASARSASARTSSKDGQSGNESTGLKGATAGRAKRKY